MFNELLPVLDIQSILLRLCYLPALQVVNILAVVRRIFIDGGLDVGYLIVSLLRK